MTILFDLDGTLLQMDNDDFLERYTEVIGNYFERLGYNRDEFLNTYNSGFYHMIKNDGGQTNEEVFLKVLGTKFDINRVNEDLNQFFATDFDLIKTITRVDEYPRLVIKALKEKGHRLILATNPLFPRVCTYRRIKWAGLDPNDFDYISTYENSSFSKPYREYYIDLIKKNNLDINKLVMIGNDIDDDFTYLPEEIDKLLVTDFLINRHNKMVSNICSPFQTVDKLI